jgi:hypothetical protein
MPIRLVDKIACLHHRLWLHLALGFCSVKVVTRIKDRTVPAFSVVRLWRDGRDLPIVRLRDILRDDVDALFAAGPVQIVVAQMGAPLLWTQPDFAPRFWKRTSKSAYYRTISFHGQQPDYSVSIG